MQDSLTIGIVLFLLIAALGVYIWLRFQQVETRLSLAESILLDMKMVTQSFSQFPLVSSDEIAESSPASYESEVSNAKTVSYTSSPISMKSSTPTINITKFDSVMEKSNEMEPLTGLLSSENDFPSVLDEVKKEMSETSIGEDFAISSGDITFNQASSFTVPSSGNDYNGMTLKDLRALAKNRGISGTGSMNRGQLIAILQEKETSAETVQMEYEIANDGEE